MATLYTLKETNVRKTYLYLVGFLVLIIVLGWIGSYYFQNESFFWFAFITSILTSLGSYWFSDRIVLGMTKAKPIEKKDSPELYRLVENLCITAGLPLPKVYIISDPAPNAFATGRDPKHSAIAVTTGLLEKLERTELEGVIAHELSHIGNRDTLLATIVVILVGLIVRITDFFFRTRLRARRDRDKDVPPIFLLLSLAFLFLSPILAQLLRFAISRKREFLADATGVLLTRYPEGLARALEKISQDPNILRTASNATAHLFIANPLKGKESKSWLVRLFSTHPPIKERIAALRQMQ